MKKFDEPVFEIQVFTVDDVITTSGDDIILPDLEIPEEE